MKANTTIETFDLKLNKPTLKVGSVTYNWNTDICQIQLIFQEENSLFKHSRQLEYDTEGTSKTPADILDYVKTQYPQFS